jgi:hypothetical protein
MAQDFAHLWKAGFREQKPCWTAGKIPALRGALLQCMFPPSK